MSEVQFGLWSYKGLTKLDDGEVGVHFVNHKYDYMYRLIGWHKALLPINHYNFHKSKSFIWNPRRLNNTCKTWNTQLMHSNLRHLQAA